MLTENFNNANFFKILRTTFNRCSGGSSEKSTTAAASVATTNTTTSTLLNHLHYLNQQGIPQQQLKYHHSSLLLSSFLTTAATNESCDENSLVCDTKDPHHHQFTPTSNAIKMRWQQLAHDAFNYSLNQRIKQQQQQQQQTNNVNDKNQCANGTNNPLIMKNPTSQNHQANFLLKQDLIDLIALNTSVNNNKLLKCNGRFDRTSPWVQLSGHENSFALAGPGTIWKKHSPDSTEINVYQCLCNEPIAEMIPKFYRNVQYKGDNFIELEDLLYHFKDASIMDIKMGTRTFLESEVSNQKARGDLYEKMIRIDPSQLTDEEHQAKAVTKLRYMKFREDLSSSSNLGFRIEGFKVGNNVKHNKNLHMIKEMSDVQRILEQFFQAKRNVLPAILNRLKKLRKYFENSPFFQKHEVIGSSLLIIYTVDKAGVWMIDFAKTLPVPEHVKQIDHRSPWIAGNHEDGYLFGLDNLIAILTNILVKSS